MRNKLLLLILLMSSNVFAYVTTRTEYDQVLKWSSEGSSTLDIYVDSKPIGNSTSGLSEEVVRTIVDETILEWNKYSPNQLEVFYTQDLPAFGTSKTISFSSDSSYFGAGVLAITSVSHSAATGQIYSADILINDSFTNPSTFTSSASNSSGYYAYLGDMLAHEMGHFLGLGHSDVYGSTMVFSIFKDQHTIHADDIAGIDYLYSNMSEKGSLSGRIISGNSIPVFGSQVQAISYSTGKVVSGVLSESDGRFEIKNLPEEDSYLIYILPPRDVANLPTYYQSIKTKYCSGKDYVPSFFTKCGGSNKGHPQAISLRETSSVELGDITIKCDEGLDPKYLYTKMQSTLVPSVLQEVEKFQISKTLGSTFVGYFTTDEVRSDLAGKGDKLTIDLTNFEHPGDTNYYLSIKIITEEIGSPLGTYADVYDYSDSLIQSVDMTTGAQAQKKTNLVLEIPLSVTESENVFSLHIFPRELSSSELNENFANHSVMTNGNSTYLVLTSISRISNSSLVSYAMKDSSPYDDNFACVEGEATYTARPNAIVTSDFSDGDSDPQSDAVSCGTIDIDNGSGPGSGMMSFCLGAIIIYFLGLMGRKSINISL